MSTTAAPTIAGRPGSRREQRDRLLWLVEHRAQLLALVALVAIVAGGLLHLAGEDAAAHQVWRAAVALLAVRAER